MTKQWYLSSWTSWQPLDGIVILLLWLHDIVLCEIFIFCCLPLFLSVSPSLPLSPSLSPSLFLPPFFPSLSLTSCEYKNTCSVLVNLFDQTASSYQELLQQPSPPPQQLLLREGIPLNIIVLLAIEILASESSLYKLVNQLLA